MTSSWPASAGGTAPCACGAAGHRHDARASASGRARGPGACSPRRAAGAHVRRADRLRRFRRSDSRPKAASRVESARVEDRVDARVTRDVKVGDRVAIPAGARAIGSVMQVERGGKFKERARLGIRFHTLVLADGTRIPIATETIYPRRRRRRRQHVAEDRRRRGRRRDPRRDSRRRQGHGDRRGRGCRSRCGSRGGRRSQRGDAAGGLAADRAAWSSRSRSRARRN